MGLIIYQVNIRNFTKLQYTLATEISNYNPDVILLNETALNPLSHPKIPGYKGVMKSHGQYSGVAIFIKIHLLYEYIHVDDDNSLAIKLMSEVGPIVIATNYCPPRQQFIPTPSMSKVLKHNLPTVFISDFNAHHPCFNNCTGNQPYGDPKGKVLYSFIQRKNLHFLGPDFSTYVSHNRGKPDLIVGNSLIKPFHHFIEAGDSMGSDHIPIIFKLSLAPFKIPIIPKKNINKMDTKQFKEKLSHLTKPDLQDKLVEDMDTLTNKLMSEIIQASDKCSPTTNILVVKHYNPTAKIKRLMNQYRAATFNHYRFGAPNREYLSNLLNNLVNEVKKDKSEYWDKIVKESIANYGNPKKFWSKINCLLAKKSIHTTQSLKIQLSDGTTQHITSKQEMANLMSEMWSSVFREHQGLEFNNDNVTAVEDWYNQIFPSLQHDRIIDMTKLKDDHPLIRPMTVGEIKLAIKLTGNKAPGISGIKQFHLMSFQTSQWVFITNK